MKKHIVIPKLEYLLVQNGILKSRVLKSGTPGYDSAQSYA